MSTGTPTAGRARHGDVEIAYEVLGPPENEPLLLIMGLGMQLLFWHPQLCADLVARGYRVARFDNRDVGLSTHFGAARVPSVAAALTRPRAVAPYRLGDMAGDAVAVLDALGWESAHVWGTSMGGAIAQTLAIEHPARVRSLTSMMSTPSPRIGWPTPRAARALAAPAGRTAEENGDRTVATFAVIGSPGYPLGAADLWEYGRQAFGRGFDPGGARRQLAAMLASGSRVRALGAVRIPTLVVHGAADPLVRPVGGRATAAAVPGSRLVVVPGMGHSLPRELWPTALDALGTVTGVRG